MKIIKLTSENIKRLTAVTIEPSGNIITIGGKNGAGKSSVLDSIAYALGGKELVPSEPIRQGESEAKIEVDLGDIIVTRRFKREPIPRDADKSPDLPGNRVAWTETKSTLQVKNKDGAVFQSPQAMLDKMLGRLSFDPLAFVDAKDQADILRKITNLDTRILDEKRSGAYGRRTEWNRRVKQQETIVNSAPTFNDVPDDEISISDVSSEMLEAERLRAAADTIARNIDATRSDVERLQAKAGRHQDIIKKLEQDLEKERKSLGETHDEIKRQEVFIEQQTPELEAARAKVPDVEVIRKKITDAEETNRKVRAMKNRNAAVEELGKMKQEAVKADQEIAEIDRQKDEMMRAAQFPVEGLGLNDDGVTWNGVPFEQASMADKIRVSVAIGRALNPKVRVLLIREGSSLDTDSLKLLGEEAAAHDLQLWVERVAENKEGVSVMIEDGHIA